MPYWPGADIHISLYIRLLITGSRRSLKFQEPVRTNRCEPAESHHWVQSRNIQTLTHKIALAMKTTNLPAQSWVLHWIRIICLPSQLSPVKHLLTFFCLPPPQVLLHDPWLVQELHSGNTRQSKLLHLIYNFTLQALVLVEADASVYARATLRQTESIGAFEHFFYRQAVYFVGF